jgi:hypothetical protein
MDDKLSQRSRNNQSSPRSSSGYLDATGHPTVEYTIATRTSECYTGDSNDDEWDEVNETETDEEELNDVLSFTSDVEFDDANSIASSTSNTDDDAPVLGVLIDVLVNMITERSDIVSRLVEKYEGQNTESARLDEVDASPKSTQDAKLHQGSNQKTDLDGLNGGILGTGSKRKI